MSLEKTINNLSSITLKKDPKKKLIVDYKGIELLEESNYSGPTSIRYWM